MENQIQKYNLEKESNQNIALLAVQNPQLNIIFKMFIKIHNSYRNVVALADADLIGKKFEEGKF